MSRFRVALVISKETVRARVHSLVASHELAHVMIAICDYLSNDERARFDVNGFGDNWPVDVRVDLAVVVEQLPEILEGLALRRRAELGFYEQGIERFVTFEPGLANDQIRVTCSSATTWVPNPNEYVEDRREVLEMFLAFGRTFANIARDECPGPSTHSEFRRWLARLDAVSNTPF